MTYQLFLVLCMKLITWFYYKQRISKSPGESSVPSCCLCFVSVLSFYKMCFLFVFFEALLTSVKLFSRNILYQDLCSVLVVVFLFFKEMKPIHQSVSMFVFRSGFFLLVKRSNRYSPSSFCDRYNCSCIGLKRVSVILLQFCALNILFAVFSCL